MSDALPRRGLRGRSYWALMAAQSLGSFNDNVLRIVVSLMVVSASGAADAEGSRVWLLAGVTVLFALPYLLFSTFAGSLADRYSKSRVIFWSKAAEIAVACLAGLALWTGSTTLSLATVFLMGTQSAFFSPVKYGALPELLSNAELSRGNGLVEFFSDLMTILGMACGGLLMQALGAGQHLQYIGLVLAGVAALGTMASALVEPLPPADPARRFAWNFAPEAWANLRALHGDRALFLSILGVSYFWLMGALFQSNFMFYGRQVLGLQADGVGYLLAVAGLGVGAGGVLAGRLSGEKVEFGLVPIGAAMMALFSADLFFAPGSGHPVARAAADLFLLGAGSGLYLVPLISFVQQRAPCQAKGTVISTGNLLNFAGVILGAVLFAAVGQYLNPAQVFLFLAALTVGVTAYIFKLLPDFLLRFVLWSFAHAGYRIRVTGAERVPREGGALLVCNHVSYLDALLVLACIQRFVRFIMYRRFYEWPVVNWGARQFKVIPISESDPARKMLQALRDAGELVRNGELVCIFAEGSITRTGNLLRFQRGFERIMKGLDAPIIPIYIDRMWGSIFSFEGGRAIWKLPRLGRSKVTVAFGSPLPAAASAAQVRQAVSELGAEAFALRKGDQVLLHEAFIAAARSGGRRLCLADTTGASLSFRRALWNALALADFFKRKLRRDPEMVGVLLPATVAGALVNIALVLAGKVPVNLNYTAGRENLASALRQCRIRTVITHPEFLEKVRLADLRSMTGSGALTLLNVGSLREQIGFWPKFWAAVKGELCPESLLARLYGRPGRDPDDLATVIFSSGSTGEPKGVMLTHANVMSDLEGLSQVFSAGSRDRIAGVLPFFHSLGFTATLWLPLVKRIGVVYHPNPTEGRAVGAMVREFGATALLATPTFLRIYERTVFPGDFGSLKDVVVGAEKLREDAAGAFLDKFGLRPMEGYGCTECSPVVSINVPDFRSRGIMQKGAKSGTIGQAIPGVSVRVVDPDTRAPLPLGRDGLLLVKGANVMKGYLGQPELTAEVIRDGWYVTGDIARLDEDGFITITDRLSRFSKIGGEMVPHGRVEEAIERALGAPDGSGGPLVAVTSVPDEKRGERLVVLHRKLPVSVEELWQKLNASDLPKLFLPRREDFHEVAEIPLLGTGKVDLRGIKKLAAELAERKRSDASEDDGVKEVP